MWRGALFSTVLGTEIPGPGTIYFNQTLHFLRPVGLRDTVTVARKDGTNHIATFDYAAINQRDESSSMASPKSLLLPEPENHHYRRRIQTAGFAALRTAVVHPVETISLLGAIEAAQAKGIVPVLVGPEAKIRAAADQAKLDPAGYELVSTEHSMRQPLRWPRSRATSRWMRNERKPPR
jgi:hypothetical protein